MIDNKAFFKMSYGLYVISTELDGKHCGVIVNTLLQTSANPAQVTVTISKNSYTGEMLKSSKKFCATVITESADIDFIGNFGFKCSKGYDKFANVSTAIGDNGVKYSTDHAAAVFECTVTDMKDIGTHIMFFATVDVAKTLSDTPVMTYAYYHSVVKGTTPKDSPLYKGNAEGETGYKCSICAHVEKVDALPDDFVCPICGKGKEFFEKL